MQVGPIIKLRQVFNVFMSGFGSAAHLENVEEHQQENCTRHHVPYHFLKIPNGSGLTRFTQLTEISRRRLTARTVCV